MTSLTAHDPSGPWFCHTLGINFTTSCIMGIAGLSTTIAEAEVVKPLEFFEDGIFYIDGLNLYHSIGEQAEKRPSVNADLKRRVETLARQKIESFLRMKPRAIYLFVDGYFPPEKVPIRVSRRRASMWSQTGSPLARSIAFNWLISNCEDVQVIFPGLEGEAGIVQHLYEHKSTASRSTKWFIFSDDSDIYTYDVPMKQQVFGVPLNSNHGKRRRVINFGFAWRLVPSKYYIKMPLREIHESVFNPKFPCGKILQTVNSIGYDGNFQVFLQSFVSQFATDPHRIALRIRRAQYAFMLNTMFHGRNKTIVEYHEKDFDYSSEELQKASKEELQEVLQEVLTTPIQTLVYQEFKRTQQDTGFTNSEIEATYRYVEDLLAGKCDSGRVYSFRTIQVKVHLGALLSALSKFASVARIPRKFGGIEAKVNEFQLCKYIP